MRPLPAELPVVRDALGEVVCQFRVLGIVKGRKQPVRFTNKFTGKQFYATPEDTRTYQRTLAQEAALAMRNRPPVTFPVAADIIAYLPLPRSKSRRWCDAALRGDIRPNVKPDWDNVGKQLDGAKGIIWLDDKQVADARVRKFYSLTPGLVVTIRGFKIMELL